MLGKFLLVSTLMFLMLNEVESQPLANGILSRHVRSFRDYTVACNEKVAKRKCFRYKKYIFCKMVYVRKERC